MQNRDEREVEKYLQNLLVQNSLEDLDSWMQIISSAEFAAHTGDSETAEALYKLALDFGEENMSTEVIVNSLLCLTTFYRQQLRNYEAEAAYARAIALFNTIPVQDL